MTLHGIRIYLNDLPGIFGPLAPAWRGHIFAKDFGITVNSKGEVEDPLPGLRELYGSALLAADVMSQFVLLHGDDFGRWGAVLWSSQGALLPIFREAPSFELLTQLYYGRDFRLTANTWPSTMRALLHMWDGAYWQMFTTELSDFDTLIRAHQGDSTFEMFEVDIEHEFPHPSNRPLKAATLSRQPDDA